jgi:hypothetical protein
MGDTWNRLKRESDRKRSSSPVRYEQFNEQLYIDVIRAKGGFLRSISWKEQLRLMREQQKENGY